MLMCLLTHYLLIHLIQNYETTHSLSHIVVQIEPQNMLLHIKSISFYFSYRKYNLANELLFSVGFKSKSGKNDIKNCIIIKLK